MASEESGWTKVVTDHEGAEAIVEDEMVAVADSKRHARAIAGDFGVAIARGRFARAEAGRRSLAMGSESAVAGQDSIAIALSGRASAGPAGVVVGEAVMGGPGAALVARRVHFDTGVIEYAVGVVGVDGIEAGVAYACEAGLLKPVNRGS
jgi:hypothetical protein